MDTILADTAGSPGIGRIENMRPIPGGVFLMGSDKHYPEEAPAHRVKVDPFWIDRTPVTNRQFKEFVRATGHVTVAEAAPRAECDVALAIRPARAAGAGSRCAAPGRP